MRSFLSVALANFAAEHAKIMKSLLKEMNIQQWIKASGKDNGQQVTPGCDGGLVRPAALSVNVTQISQDDIFLHNYKIRSCISLSFSLTLPLFFCACVRNVMRCNLRRQWKGHNGRPPQHHRRHCTTRLLVTFPSFSCSAHSVSVNSRGHSRHQWKDKIPPILLSPWQDVVQLL